MRLLVVMFIGIVDQALAQENTVEEKKFSHSISLGMGRTWFDFNNRNFSDYPAVEARLGWGISRQLSNRISIKSGLSLGVRAKRPSHLKGQLYTGSGPLLLPVDETASKQSHFMVEIPLVIEYSMATAPIILQLGIRGRDWLPTQLNGDILRSQKEVGLSPAVSYKLKKKLVVGLEWYFGLTKIYSGAIYDEFGNLLVDFTVRNQSITAFLSYRLQKK